jgi:CTP:molybdopterin cytidylyltransferase MocA
VTVAAVILAATPASALADADGMARVRREADAAWSGGATPVVVVTADPDGTVATALAGAPVTLAEPAPADAGPVGQIVRGIELARDLVSETSAALIWPARMAWVGPETVTSLLEAHGGRPDRVLRPAFRGEPGWPVVIPLAAVGSLAALGPDRMPDELLADLEAAGATTETVELGDPGVVIDGETPSSELPPYDGPPEPASDHAHEWGAAIADEPEGPPSSPPIVPYPADPVE